MTNTAKNSNKNIDLLIHARWLITCEDNNQTLENHALAIKDGNIIDILPSRTASEHYQATAEEHYTNHAVLPGLINAHTHLAMNLFRGLADDLPLMTWLSDHVWVAEAKWVDHAFVYDGSLLAMAEMIRGGSTCFNDMYFFMDATAEATIKAGIRGSIGMTVIDVPTAWAKTTDEYFAKALAFHHMYHDVDRITPTLAPHSTYTLNDDALIKVKALADKLKLKINLHLLEAHSEIEHSESKYKMRPLQRLEALGMLSPDLIAIHMTQLNEADLDLLQEKKPNLIHCPESNMKTASGISPVQQLLNRGINVALGTDGAASNNDLDMIGEMRTAALVGKIAANDATAVSAEQVLKMATLHGAKALGIDHITGSLTKGKAADFIAIDLSAIETQPLYHPISQIVYASTRSQVTDVWVAGKQLLKNRELTTLDEKELLQKTHAWREKISGLR